MKFAGYRLSVNQVTALSFLPVGIPFTLEDVKHVCHERTLDSLVDKGIISYIDGAYLLESPLYGARHTIPPKPPRKLQPDKKLVQEPKIEAEDKKPEIVKPIEIIEIKEKPEPPRQKIETLNTMAWK